MKTRPANEAELQAALVEAAMLLGWKVFHVRPARLVGGEWRSAITGHAGAPDLWLARRGVVFAWELKGPTGRVADAQREWLEHLDGGVADARVIRPDDLDDALLALHRGAWPTGG